MILGAWRSLAVTMLSSEGRRLCGKILSTAGKYYAIISGTFAGPGKYGSEEELLAQQWLNALDIIQIVLGVVVILFILLQASGAGLGSVFGGSSAGSVYKTRRGVERLVFNLTIVFVVLFALVSLLITILSASIH